jgi:hypothetical protein
MVNGHAKFEVACARCTMRLVVDRIRDPEARAMTDHLRERHPELRVSEAAALGEVLDHFAVKPTGALVIGRPSAPPARGWR